MNVARDGEILLSTWCIGAINFYNGRNSEKIARSEEICILHILEDGH